MPNEIEMWAYVTVIWQSKGRKKRVQKRVKFNEKRSNQLMIIMIIMQNGWNKKIKKSLRVSDIAYLITTSFFLQCQQSTFTRVRRLTFFCVFFFIELDIEIGVELCENVFNLIFRFQFCWIPIEKWNRLCECNVFFFWCDEFWWGAKVTTKILINLGNNVKYYV